MIKYKLIVFKRNYKFLIDNEILEFFETLGYAKYTVFLNGN